MTISKISIIRKKEKEKVKVDIENIGIEKAGNGEGTIMVDVTFVFSVDNHKITCHCCVKRDLNV